MHFSQALSQTRALFIYLFISHQRIESFLDFVLRRPVVHLFFLHCSQSGWSSAKRCGHSKPPNNRPFMMPCNAMMILLCPPAPTLHQLPQLHRNVVQQVTLSPPSLLVPAAATAIPTAATTSPVLPPSQPKSLFPQIKKMKKARNYGRGGGGLQTEHKERIHACSHTLPEKKEGVPFKCGAAALIHWVKMGEKGLTEVR